MWAWRGWLALLALLGQHARGADYGGGPLYGDGAPAQYGAQLDYRAPLPAAPLDYNLEDSQGHTERATKDILDLETWKTPARKRVQRRENPSGVAGAELEALPRSKGTRRRARGRAAPPGLPRRRRARRPRPSDDDFSSKDYLDKDDYRVNKNKLVDDDLYTSNLGTTERIIRRKPRDRLFSNYVKPLRSGDLDLEEDLMLDRKLKGDSVERDEAPDEGELEPDEPAPAPRARPPALYRDPSDYYDMRRLQDVKSKLPLLLRRTTTRAPEERGAAGATDLLSLLWTARRRAGSAASPAPAPAPSPRRTVTPTSTSTEAPPTLAESLTTGPPADPPAETASSELSIAEKSRLSILKKSQKKDSDKGEPSKKPPVLLQVTSKLPTVVMVEPATSANPWMRARPVSGDSPRQLEKVKSLMRHKLVAGARNIQELTDNWDDMVCDYIDVALLDAAEARAPAACALLGLQLLLARLL